MDKWNGKTLWNMPILFDESIYFYKADEVDARIREFEEQLDTTTQDYVETHVKLIDAQEENEKIIIEYQTEITRLRKMLKGRCTDKEWEEI